MGNKMTAKAVRISIAILRVAEIVCGSVVLVIMALFLHHNGDLVLKDIAKEIWIALSISAVSVVVAILFLPSSNMFFRYFILDFILGVVWFATFAMLLITFTKTRCEQAFKSFGAIATGGTCNSQRAAWGFAFLSGGLWLGSFVVGAWAVRKEKKERAKTSGKK